MNKLSDSKLTVLFNLRIAFDNTLDLHLPEAVEIVLSTEKYVNTLVLKKFGW